MLNFILLDAAQGTQQGGGWSFWIMMILIFVVFYFFMIRPQKKRQKELQDQRDAMKKGDKVVTAGGIHGTIKEVNENDLMIQIAKDVVIKVEKASVYASAQDAQQDQQTAAKEPTAEQK